MSKPYSPKIERKIIKRTIKQGLFDPIEAQADDEQYERFLEEQERKALRKKRKNNKKDWDDDA